MGVLYLNCCDVRLEFSTPVIVIQTEQCVRNNGTKAVAYPNMILKTVRIFPTNPFEAPYVTLN